MTNAMKIRFTLLTLVVAMLSSVSLFAQGHESAINDGYDRYDGKWPKGEGILYSYKEGLIIGTFSNGKAEGRCICYKPNGEVYWGDFKKGKATGNGRVYRDNGIVMAGGYRNGKYHGLDTLYRSDGRMIVGKFRNGKLKARMAEAPAADGRPEYPRVDLKRKQEEFLKELELIWEERNIRLMEKAGLVSPRFQGGSVEDFALWVNSRVEYPESLSLRDGSRTVIVEFTVLKDGTVSDVHAAFGSNPQLNEAAVEAVSRSPKWEPGQHNGQKRSVRMTVPVVFSNE
jgi:TonB family protein